MALLRIWKKEISQWRRRRDVLRGQSVPQSGSGDRKSSIANGWKTGTSDNKRYRNNAASACVRLVVFVPAAEFRRRRRKRRRAIY